MGAKKRNRNRNISTETEGDFQIISDEELFADVNDYDEAEEKKTETESNTESETETEIVEEVESHEPEAEEEQEDSEDEEAEELEDADNEDIEEQEDSQLKDSEEKGSKKRGRIVLLSILVLLVVTYLGASGYFYTHFYLHTTINGVDVSMNTVAQVQDYMDSQVHDYSLTLVELDSKTEKIEGEAISLEYEKDDSVEKLLKEQNPFLWFTALWQTQEIESPIGVYYDTDQLETVIGKLSCTQEENQTAPVSAYPELQGSEYVIKEEQYGTELDEEVFAEAVNTAISGFQPELNLEEEGCYVAPKYTTESPEVEEARDTMNSYLGADVTLDFYPYTEEVDASVISQWISVDDDMQVTFDQELVRTYVAELAEKYDTYGKTRTITTGYGDTVQVDGGSYGWLIDQEAEYNALLENIQNADVVTREPNYSRRAASHEGNDFGTTYAEVDLTNQHMFYYVDGQCVMQSDIVTGNPNKGYATPQGVYSLSYKAKDQTLRGPKQDDGTYEWESPVSYWMPFNGGIGFHDADWQSAFGGERYLTYGSHGCVNMPPAAAAELYSYIEAGIPVVCHY